MPHGSLLKKMEALDTHVISAYAPSPEAWRRRHAAYLTAKLGPSQIKRLKMSNAVFIREAPENAYLP